MQFEDLVVAICKKLFGVGTQSFADGPDGGRDARFHGTAELFPSSSSPWSGVTVIQSKHTSGYNTSFSDSSFFKDTNNSSIIVQETTKVKKLYDSKELDNYLLISNRSLTANANQKIKDYIHNETGINKFNIHLMGLQDVEDTLKRYKEIAEQVDIKPGDMPLSIDPLDLAELIEHLVGIKTASASLLDEPVARTRYETKNQINGLSSEYAASMKSKYLRYTYEIDQFLQHPANESKRDLYLDIVDEFQRKIIAKSDNYPKFDDVLNHLIDLLFSRDSYLKGHKQLTKAMLFYMYWNCDLGKSS